MYLQIKLRRWVIGAALTVLSAAASSQIVL